MRACPPVSPARSPRAAASQARTRTSSGASCCHAPAALASPAPGCVQAALHRAPAGQPHRPRPTRSQVHARQQHHDPGLRGGHLWHEGASFLSKSMPRPQSSGGASPWWLARPPPRRQVGGIRRVVVPLELGYPQDNWRKLGPKPTTFAVRVVACAPAGPLAVSPAARRCWRDALRVLWWLLLLLGRRATVPWTLCSRTRD